MRWSALLALTEIPSFSKMASRCTLSLSVDHATGSRCAVRLRVSVKAQINMVTPLIQ